MKKINYILCIRLLRLVYKIKRKLFIIISAIFIITFLFISVFTIGKQEIYPICYVQTEKKLISFTFDDGGEDKQVCELLRVLKEKKIKATFFIIGEWAKEHTDMVKKINEDGHDIGNHSYTHPFLPNLNKENLESEIEKCNKVLEKIINKKIDLFRAPFGATDKTVIKKAEEKKMFLIKWNIDTVDWKKGTTEEQILKTVKNEKRKGSIILMHMGKNQTIKVLPKLIKHLNEEDYEIVPISRLIYKDSGYFTTEKDGKQLEPIHMK
ncbi:MAG: polysaccharide deacetylase family protein [Candidatus Paraimprobicoccus trichonymphae]|uniref:Polysaccharide deacetylase family protein n=1 Tax=Candidatus Paraimprobicoccus trichonymphae TaxID=3033793 RepID=A0AA48KZP7_9FIRM|nr:MAG: polysaccharide deacetylase family protein [Candidatus Paraimprobicoccus trichonymphae]